jgi:polyphenol oxidase
MLFIKSARNLNLLEFNNIAAEQEIMHCITTRKGGCSDSNWSTLNLSLKVNDKEENVKQNRSFIASHFNTKKDKFFFPDQCHTNNVKIITETTKIEDLKETDALITNIPRIIIGILSADCVPILLFDPVKKVVAEIHAGWKGTVKNIVTMTIGSMKINFKCEPQNILAGIGPSISSERYEVGTEVSGEFKKLFGENPDIIKYNSLSGKDHIDLQKANQQLLINNGLKSENIENSSLCTYNNSEWFYSARRDGLYCGRFALLAMIL